MVTDIGAPVQVLPEVRLNRTRLKETVVGFRTAEGVGNQRA